MPSYRIIFSIAREYADDEHARAAARLLQRAVLARDPLGRPAARIQIVREPDAVDVTSEPSAPAPHRPPIVDPKQLRPPQDTNKK